MNFASDNTAGVAPEILQALAAGNDGFAMGYGNDDVTRAVEQRIGEIFERDVAVFLVPTGTAANALALAHVSPPWGAVFAHHEAHILTDECGAPEFFGGGLKLVGMPGDRLQGDAGARSPKPSRITKATRRIRWCRRRSRSRRRREAGTIYRPDEIAALAKVAHAHGMKVHMDGARFANALVRMNASPARGRPGRPASMCCRSAPPRAAPWRRRRWCSSTVRSPRTWPSAASARGTCCRSIAILALQFQAYLANDCWLRLARHANAMADLLASRLGRHRPVPRPGRSRPIWCSSCCRKPWKRGCAPPAPAIMCATAKACRRRCSRINA